jgi:hypothetical protein
MARLKRKSIVMDDGLKRAAALKTVDPAMDFGNGASLAALTAGLADVETKLNTYNGLLSQSDDALNQLGAAEKTVTDLSTRLLSGVRTKYGADSSQYEAAGGTRTSEKKKPVRQPKPAAAAK